jgi:penicillin-binding protein 2
MFERRLKVLLFLLFFVGLVLLARAFQLQVFAHEQWKKEAEGLGHRRHLVETIRGTIKDYRGKEIAVDHPCIDACVEYGAIVKEPEWIKSQAFKRLAITQPGVYRRADQKTRDELLTGAQVKVSEDIDHMWAALAQEAKSPLDKIEEARQSIEQRIQIRERYLQFRNFSKASDEKRQSTTTTAPWYQRILTAGTNDKVDIDSFEIHSDDQQQAHPIVRNISSDTYTRLAKDIDKYPGLVLREGSVRVYPQNETACHILGTVGRVGDKELESAKNDRDDPGRYLPNDLTGRGGLEQLAEPTLRGTRGYIEFPAGEPDNIVFEQKSTRGKDVQTTIDVDLVAEIQHFFQTAKVADNTNENRKDIKVPMHGAAVVIDIPTSEVRAIASYPTFDPNKVMDDYDQYARQFLEAPLTNRATYTARFPGSTVKPIVGLGAITDGIWTTQKGISCEGYLIIDGKRQPDGKCWTMSFRNYPGITMDNIIHHGIPTQFPHKGQFGNPDGSLVFVDALERSCNVYFETLASKMGPERLSSWFNRFGLGHETGLGILEACGQIPHAEDRFPPSLVWFSGIGQARVRATPIQMANAVAAIARRGIWMKPKLLVGDVETAPVPLRRGLVLPDRVDLHLSKDALDAALEGMLRVINEPSGTGYKGAHMEEILLAGKTGTAQGNPEYQFDAQGHWLKDKNGDLIPIAPATYDHPTSTPWYRGWGSEGAHFNHAWFVGVVPATNPKFAIAIMVEHGGSGGAAAGGIAKRIIYACARRGYLKLNMPPQHPDPDDPQ